MKLSGDLVDAALLSGVSGATLVKGCGFNTLFSSCSVFSAPRQSRSVKTSGLNGTVPHFSNHLIIFKGIASFIYASPNMLLIWKTGTTRPGLLFINFFFRAPDCDTRSVDT